MTLQRNFRDWVLTSSNILNIYRAVKHLKMNEMQSWELVTCVSVYRSYKRL